MLSLLVQKVVAKQSCVVLQYHHFSSNTPKSTSVTPQQFQAHLDYLKQENFAVMPLDVVIDAITEGYELPDKCVSFTADDAYESVYTEAWPRLKQYGWTMSVFVDTDAINAGQRYRMSWGQIRELAAAGVQFENHSSTHEHLIRQRTGEDSDDWEQRIASDILMAQDQIARETGRAPRFFAHPYGEFNPGTQRILRSLGLFAFGQQSGPVWPDADLYALPRFPMAAGYAELPGFKTKVNSLAMPITKASPRNPLVALDQWQPGLELQFQPGQYQKSAVTCFANGSRDVNQVWLEDKPDTLRVSPNVRLQVGRNRYNCTMSSQYKGRFHWYSHNWIRRRADGSWYKEY